MMIITDDFIFTTIETYSTYAACISVMYSSTIMTPDAIELHGRKKSDINFSKLAVFYKKKDEEEQIDIIEKFLKNAGYIARNAVISQNPEGDYVFTNR